jgi:type II secretion system protein N
LNDELDTTYDAEDLSEVGESGTSKRRKGVYGMIFLLSFPIFLYLTFPFGPSKEYISSKLNQELGVRVRIGALSPAFPLGLVLEDVKFSGANSRASFKLDTLEVRLKILPMFLGRIAFNVYSTAGKGGLFDFDASISGLDILKGYPLPRTLSIDSKKFPVGGMIAYFLSRASNSVSGNNPIVKELLENIVFQGKLNATIDFDIDVFDPTLSSGTALIELAKSQLSFADPNIAIAPQNFKVAKLKASVRDGDFVVEKASRFKSQGLDFAVNGKIKLREDLVKSQVNIDIMLKLDQELKQNYGFLLGAKQELNAELSGFLSRVVFNKK